MASSSLVYRELQRVKDDLAAVDPWLTAHAIASGGKVVTQETRAGENSKRVKIPNVCDAFGVESLNMDDMLRELGATIG